ncbi:hypothetical protein [Amycolatopsis cihanbeyliensis]|nr:hypothetical protein [Amycolatopsis cihanbeyliensis]
MTPGRTSTSTSRPTPPIDHLCVHLVSYVDPADPLEIPTQIGHRGE